MHTKQYRSPIWRVLKHLRLAQLASPLNPRPAPSLKTTAPQSNPWVSVPVAFVVDLLLLLSLALATTQLPTHPRSHINSLIQPPRLATLHVLHTKITRPATATASRTPPAVPTTWYGDPPSVSRFASDRTPQRQVSCTDPRESDPAHLITRSDACTRVALRPSHTTTTHHPPLMGLLDAQPTSDRWYPRHTPRTGWFTRYLVSTWSLLVITYIWNVHNSS